MPSNQKIPFLTTSVKRFTLWNVFLFLILILLVNVMFILVAVYILHSGIDKRLSHEMEKVIATLEVGDSTISIIDFSEINEYDFTTVNEESMFFQIYDLNGNILISSDNLKDFLPIPPELDYLAEDIFFGDFNSGDDRLRMDIQPLYNSNGGVAAIIQIATFENELRIVRNRMILFNLFLLPLIILLVAAASIYLAKKSFKPINYIIETAEQISAKRLTTRIEYDAKPNDELGRLRDTLNGLFDRLQSYLNQLSQFTDQASHQLMNPLTAIKTELEFILKKERSTDEYKQSLEQLLIQSDHMINIVRTLLILSKQDKETEVHKSIFNLSKLIRSQVSEKIDLHKILFFIEDNIYIKGDSEKFKMVLQNLVDNAVKYSPENKTVKVSLNKINSKVELIVADQGIGIVPDERAKVFDRFYRSIKSEELGIKGYGLGLSLVKTILLEIGAEIKITDNQPSGTCLVITLTALNID